MQLREDPRQRGRRSEDESGGRSRGYDDDRRESGIPERDVRALDNARETIRRGVNDGEHVRSQKKTGDAEGST